jgi:hypothetical protein
VATALAGPVLGVAAYFARSRVALLSFGLAGLALSSLQSIFHFEWVPPPFAFSVLPVSFAALMRSLARRWVRNDPRDRQRRRAA